MIVRIKAVLDLFIDYIICEWLLYFPSQRFRRWIIKNRINSLGENTWFLLGLEIRNYKNISIGSNCAINKRVLLDGRGGKIIIGNNVDIAQETNIWTLQHDPNSDIHDVIGGNVIIEDFVWIASRVTILPGVKIGKGAVIGTGAIVVKNVEPMTIVGGVPAKVIAKRTSKLEYTLNYKPKFK